MILLKKLIFAPLFLIVFAFLLFSLKPLFGSYDFIFTLSVDSLIKLLALLAIPIVLSPLIILSAYLFILFASFALNWKIVLPVGITASLMPMVFLNSVYGLILTVEILASLLLTYIFLESNLKNYITFSPNSLFGPHIKSLSTYLILAISFVFLLFISKSIPPDGFKVANSFLEETPKTTTSQLPVNNKQIDLLKQNPQLLNQFGLDPTMLDNLDLSQIDNSSNNMTNDIVNEAIKDQLQGITSFINPYAGFVPAILAMLLFLNLMSVMFTISFLLRPLLWLTFLILEKTEFVKFTEEMRPVKKMII